MVSDLRRGNVGSAFDILDHDRDGTIDHEDVIAIATSMSDNLGLAENAVHRKKLLSSLDTLWEQIRRGADVDGDGRVTRDEYIAAVENGLADNPAFLDAMRGVAHAEFDALDTDTSGDLDKDELSRLYESAGMSAVTAAGAFDQIDTDGNGRISRDEWLTAFLSVHVNDDSRVVGSNFLGHAG